MPVALPLRSTGAAWPRISPGLPCPSHGSGCVDQVASAQSPASDSDSPVTVQVPVTSLRCQWLSGGSPSPSQLELEAHWHAGRGRRTVTVMRLRVGVRRMIAGRRAPGGW
jgi:hypothetical protein